MKVYSQDQLEQNMIMPLGSGHEEERTEKMSVMSRRETDNHDGSEMETKERDADRDIQSEYSQQQFAEGSEHEPLLYDYFRLYNHFQ